MARALCVCVFMWNDKCLLGDSLEREILQLCFCVCVCVCACQPGWVPGVLRMTHEFQ